MTRDWRAPRYLLVVVVGLLAMGLAWVRWIDPATWNLVDLGVYLRGGEAVLAGENPYTSFDHGLLFTYPPFAALVFTPFAVLGPSGAAWVMTMTSVASYMVLARVSLAQVRPSADRLQRTAWFVVLLVGGIALEPVQRTLIFGQINLLLAALVMLDVFVVPPRYRGLLVGLAAGIKLTPGAFVMIFLLKRDMASCVRSAAAGLGTAVAAWLVLPDASWAYWSGGFAGMDKFGDYAVHPANQSLRACWVRIFGGEMPEMVYVLTVLVVIVVTAGAASRLIRVGDDLAALTVVGVGGLLVSPVSWTHHWVWVVPVLVVMARRGWHVAGGLVAATMFLPPMWAAAGNPLHLGAVDQLLASSYVLMGAVYLVVMTMSTPSLQKRPNGDSQRELQNLGSG